MGNSFPSEKSVGTNASIKLEHAVSVERKAYTVSHYVDGKSVVILYLWITYHEDGLIKGLDFVFNGPAGSELTFFNINNAENKSEEMERSKQIRGNSFSNQGVTIGNHNGNVDVKKLFFRGGSYL